MRRGRPGHGLSGEQSVVSNILSVNLTPSKLDDKNAATTVQVKADKDRFG